MTGVKLAPIDMLRREKRIRVAEARSSRDAAAANRRSGGTLKRGRGSAATVNGRKLPQVSWGTGAQRPDKNKSIARHVPITSLQNAGAVGRAVTPGQIMVVRSSLSRSDFSGYAPLIIASSPEAPCAADNFFLPDADDVSSAIPWEEGRVPLALSRCSVSRCQASWHNTERTSDSALRFYADVYADTRPSHAPIEQQEQLLGTHSSSMDSSPDSPSRQLENAALEPEPELKPEPEPEPESPKAGKRGPRKGGVLWNKLRAQTSALREGNSRDEGSIVRSWVEVEQEASATKIQSWIRSRQARAQFLAAVAEMLRVVVNLQRLYRRYKTMGPPSAMMWTAMLATLLAKEERDGPAKPAVEKTVGQEPEPEPEPVEERELSMMEQHLQQPRTPQDFVRVFLAKLPGLELIGDLDVALGAVVTAFEVAGYDSSTWESELVEMELQGHNLEEGQQRALQDIFLPACMKKHAKEYKAWRPALKTEEEEEQEGALKPEQEQRQRDRFVLHRHVLLLMQERAHVLFGIIDANADGVLSKDELHGYLKLESSFNSIGVEVDLGDLDHQEVVKELHELIHKSGRDLHRIFEQLDTDGDQKITAGEFLKLIEDTEIHPGSFHGSGVDWEGREPMTGKPVVELLPIAEQEQKQGQAENEQDQAVEEVAEAPAAEAEGQALVAEEATPEAVSEPEPHNPS